jgi:hypothetical protein
MTFYLCLTQQPSRRDRWLYTAIARAAERVTVVQGGIR